MTRSVVQIRDRASFLLPYQQIDSLFAHCNNFNMRLELPPWHLIDISLWTIIFEHPVTRIPFTMYNNLLMTTTTIWYYSLHWTPSALVHITHYYISVQIEKEHMRRLELPMIDFIFTSLLHMPMSAKIISGFDLWCILTALPNPKYSALLIFRQILCRTMCWIASKTTTLTIYWVPMLNVCKMNFEACAK